jgi:hypothetical protein
MEATVAQALVDAEAQGQRARWELATKDAELQRCQEREGRVGLGPLVISRARPSQTWRPSSGGSSRALIPTIDWSSGTRAGQLAAPACGGRRSIGLPLGATRRW